jgi:Asp-tRNA(Asn)/Glu-tRNA(Gln) amidotransferase A subunit family amidase
VAIGTQTLGSVIRPAAFCGVVGFKPTFGRLPTEGVLSFSPSLDQVGVFARSVERAAPVRS